MGQGVVITGCGVLAANGIGREAFAAALAQGKSGIGDLVSFDASALGREKAAEIQGFDVAPFLRSPKNYLDRNSSLAFAAAEMALRESALDVPDIEKGYGLSSGSMGGNIESLGAFHAKLVEKGPRLAPPFLFPHTYYNTTAGLLSIEYGLSGPHGQFCSGHSAGMDALAYAVDCIRWGRADAMLAGGVEAFGEPLFRYCAARNWLSPIDGGAESCRPFGVAGNGTILGEGAAFLCLESADSVHVRKAAVRGRIRGIGQGASPEESMAAALRDAEILKADVIFASASGCTADDREEAAAIARLLPDKPVVALKTIVGETLGAAGPIGVVAALAALESDILPGAGQEYEAGVDSLVRKPTSQAVRIILVNSGSGKPGRWGSVVVTR